MVGPKEKRVEFQDYPMTMCELGEPCQDLVREDGPTAMKVWRESVRKNKGRSSHHGHTGGGVNDVVSQGPTLSEALHNANWQRSSIEGVNRRESWWWNEELAGVIQRDSL